MELFTIKMEISMQELSWKIVLGTFAMINKALVFYIKKIHLNLDFGKMIK